MVLKHGGTCLCQAWPFLLLLARLHQPPPPSDLTRGTDLRPSPSSAMALPLPVLPPRPLAWGYVCLSLSAPPIRIRPQEPRSSVGLVGTQGPRSHVWNKHARSSPAQSLDPRVPRSPPTKEEGGGGAGYLPAWAQLSLEVPAQWQPDLAPDHARGLWVLLPALGLPDSLGLGNTPPPWQEHGNNAHKSPFR